MTIRNAKSASSKTHRAARLAAMAVAIATAQATQAGGILTNTNQNIAFNRMMSREASIGIDGVYSNPAGVAFMKDGHHLSLNLQTAWQTRTIDNSFALFANNANNHSTERTFKGTAFAPVIPSIQYAYNKNGWSFQGNFALVGGGGKCNFDDGLGSFEKIVSETAVGAVGLAGALDGALGQQMFTADQMFGSTGSYSYKSYMRGRQYYYGLSLGVARKLTDDLSAYVGVRGVYAMANYYGYVRDIKVGSMPLYQVLDPTKENAADIELNCDQTGVGFTPIIGVDFKTGRWNFSAKYEFKTRMRLRNEAVNIAPSIGNLAGNLSTSIQAGLVGKGMSSEMAAAYTEQIITNPTVTSAMASLKTAFDTKLEEAVGEYEDDKDVAQDIPALLTLGVGYKPIDALRVNVGFHWFDDKHATQYHDKQKKLDHGTIELNAGAEYDINKTLTVSAGWQNTNYGLTESYMDDKSFVTSSNSVGLGAAIHVSKKATINVAYFHTFYSHFKTTAAEQLSATQSIDYKADFTRNNNVFGIGVDFDI